MKRLLYFISTMLVLTSCGCHRNCPYKGIQVRDSVAVTEVIRYIDSTVFYNVVDSSVVASTRDTTSHLETDMAVSDVSVSDGVLTHSLANKAEPKPVYITVPAKEKTIYKDRVITKEVEVPANLSWWQKTLIKLGYLLLIAAGAFGLIKICRNKLWR